MAEIYSVLNQSEEAMFIFGVFVIEPIGVAIAFIILFSLYRQRNNVKNIQALRFAIASVIFSVLFYFVHIFFCNNLLIPWKSDTEHQTLMTITDGINGILYMTGKIAFYCSFTFHLLSIFDNNNYKTFLKIWMVLACSVLFVLDICLFIDDISEESSKEIGVTSPHNIYVTMFVGHDGTTYVPYLFMMGFIVDTLYFTVLFYFYINQLRKTKTKNGAKSVVLIFFACLIFWLTVFVMGSASTLRWLTGVDVISDDICLYLMFEGQSILYQFWCS
eukprot:179393_1